MALFIIPPPLPPPSVSKQQAVIPSQVFELADGGSSYQDFSLSRNNRFGSAQSTRNIIQPAAAVLHFYNAPPTLSEHQLHEVRRARRKRRETFPKRWKLTKGKGAQNAALRDTFTSLNEPYGPQDDETDREDFFSGLYLFSGDTRCWFVDDGFSACCPSTFLFFAFQK